MFSRLANKCLLFRTLTCHSKYPGMDASYCSSKNPGVEAISHNTSLKRTLSDDVSSSSPPAKVKVLPFSASCEETKSEETQKIHKYASFEEFKKAMKHKKANEAAAQLAVSENKLKQMLATAGKKWEDLDANSVNDGVTISHDSSKVIPLKPSFDVDNNEENGISDMHKERRKKRMFALLLSYSGKGYLGMQINPPHPTIEGELLGALQKLDLVTEAETMKVQSINFQRAARTDKGVSAIRQVINLKLPIDDEKEEYYREELNKILPEQISVMAIIKTIRTFNSKNRCDFRSYSYLAPSFAFCPIDEVTSLEYRIKEETLTKIRTLFNNFKGTHNFHNFTIRKGANEASAKRFIHSFEVMDPFVKEGVEWLLLKVNGQSFMMHQIRKMVGLVIAISRGLVAPSHMLETFSLKKVETPKAPSLGLVLEQPHFVSYNKKYGKDGIHKALDWSGLEEQTEQFRDKFINSSIIETELKEQSMLEYLKVLHLFAYGTADQQTGDQKMNPFGAAYVNFVREPSSDNLQNIAKDSLEINIDCKSTDTPQERTTPSLENKEQQLETATFNNTLGESLSNVEKQSPN